MNPTGNKLWQQAYQNYFDTKDIIDDDLSLATLFPGNLQGSSGNRYPSKIFHSIPTPTGWRCSHNIKFLHEEIGNECFSYENIVFMYKNKIVFHTNGDRYTIQNNQSKVLNKILPLELRCSWYKIGEGIPFGKYKLYTKFTHFDNGAITIYHSVPFTKYGKLLYDAHLGDTSSINVVIDLAEQSGNKSLSLSLRNELSAHLKCITESGDKPRHPNTDHMCKINYIISKMIEYYL